MIRLLPKAPIFALAVIAGLAPQGLLAVQKEFKTGTEWATPGDWNPTGLPGAGDNVVVDSGSPATGSYTLTASSLTVEDIAFSLATTTSLANSSNSATSTLTLNGGRGSSTPLIDENSTKTFTIKNATTAGLLNVMLGVSGTFRIDSSGGLVVSSNIGEVNAGTSLTIANMPTTGTGTVTLSGTNTFSGGLIVTGSEVDVTADANLGATGGSVTINGGRLGIATNSFTVDPTRPLFLGANPTGGSSTGTLSIKGSITTTFNQGFQDLNASTAGDLVKQGGGTLQLGGASTYSGGTFLNNGITQLTTGNNRLPTGTVVYLGQSSTNNGELDLNGQSQQIAGLNSVTGTNNGSSNTSPALNTNIVTTSTGTSTLTLGGSGTYAYSDGSTQNSGNITGAVSINKTGTGSQTFGGNNTYTGSTTVSAGTLIAGTTKTGSGVQALGGTSGVNINSGGTLLLGANNQIKTTAPVTLGGTAGTPIFNTGGFSQDTGHMLGALTLSSNAALSYATLASGNTNSVLAFSNSSGQTWTGTLSVNNYSGSSAGNGTDQLFVGTTNTSLTTTQLGEINFYSDNGTTFLGTGGLLSDGEVVPVPEPATYFGGLLLVGALGWSQRRRLSGLVRWNANGRRAA